MEKELQHLVCNFPTFFVPLATPKSLSFDNISKKLGFYFVLCSHNRNFAADFEIGM